MRRNSLEISENIILLNSLAFPQTFFSFFDNSTARKGSEPARTSADPDARSTIHKRNWDNWGSVNRLWTLGKEFPWTFFFGFNNGRYVMKRSTSKATYSSDAARRFRPDAIVVNGFEFICQIYDVNKSHWALNCAIDGSIICSCTTVTVFTWLLRHKARNISRTLWSKLYLSETLLKNKSWQLGNDLIVT